MADSLQHRGPDSDGVWLSDNRLAGLAHRRLAILDVSDRSRQPMGNDAGTMQLCYNGEVYNFAQLREELQGLGYGFRTTGDAEVVLRGYEAWGDDVVHRLQGMFAFAIWDETRQRLFLARDRVGIKPLYHAMDSGRFLFASELKGLLAANLQDTRIDVSALWDYLTYAYIPSPKSAYRVVRKLPAGHTLVFENGETTLRSYWDASFAETTAAPAEQHIDALRALLEEAVTSSLVSDVPVGSFLSGGIDSSLVTALATRSHPAIHTFTVGFEGFDWSEAPVAQRTARFLHTTHREMICSADEAIYAVENIPEWFDEPFADTSALATSLVCRRARQEATVVVSGDGGDEIFGGYAHYTKWFKLMHRASLAGVQRPLGRALARRFGVSSKTRRSLNRWAMSPIDRFVAVHGGMTRFDKEDLLPADVVGAFAGYDDNWSFARYWRPELDDWSRLQYVDFKTYLPDGVLTKVDRTSMQTSLEVRPPLLDHRVIETVAGISSRVRTPDGRLKDLMKQVARGTVPDEILGREKQGFSVPTEKWLQEGVFGDTQAIAHWPASSRLLWCLLRQWTERRLGVKDPLELLRQGP
jgi:asparagine synthase (glutamine-hydrolysing)